MSNKQPSHALMVLIGVAIIIAIAVFAFLFTADGYGEYNATGLEVLLMQSSTFYFWLTACWMVAIALGYAAYANETGSGLGRKMRGGSTLTIVLIIAALSLFFIPIGRIFTDKTNGGVTAPGYKAVSK